jgi:hypothetical protein
MSDVGLALSILACCIAVAAVAAVAWCSSHPTTGRHTRRAKRVPYMPTSEVDRLFFEIADQMPDTDQALEALVEEER